MLHQRRRISLPILPQEVKLLKILGENLTGIDVSGRGRAPEEVDDNDNVAKGGYLSRQEGGNKRGGLGSPAAMSTPVKPQPPKRNRRNDTAADDETASVSRSLFSGAQSQTQESTQESARHLPSALQHGLSLCTCGHQGHIANHLKEAPQCVEELRGVEELQFMRNDSDPVFITKVALILSGCPAPECPGGDHKKKPLPEECFQWYREQGGDVMGFKDSSTASNKKIKEKINKFLKNAKNRHPEILSLSQCTSQQQTQGDGDMTQRPQNCQVCACSFEGSLAGHLVQQPGCLTAMIRQHLPSRAALYQGKPKLAVFDLSAVLYFCLNPNCTFEATGRNRRKDISEHIRGPCLNFFQNDGQDLLDWQPGLDVAIVSTKLANRRNYVTRSIRNNAEDIRLDKYKEECKTMLREGCRYCFIWGPLYGHPEHDMVVAGGTVSATEYECSSCHRKEEQHLEMAGNFRGRLQDLSLAKPADTTALVAAMVHPLTGDPRIVFVPSHLSGELQVVEDDLMQIPHDSTVMVPTHPAAVDQMPEPMFDVADNEKEALREFTGFLSRRLIVGYPAQELSVFWRMMLANIKVERKRMQTGLCNTRRGKIETRRPTQTASIKDRHPLYAMTKEFCLVSTCSWSEGALEKQSSEEKARSAVNGVVKTKVVLTLQEEVAANLASAPIYLNRAYGKMKALIKHIIGPSYAHHDLEVQFHPREWRIDLVGFLYSEGYERVNSKISAEDMDLFNITSEILKERALMPTVSIDPKALAEEYNLTVEGAEEISQLASKHQTGSEPQPLSLIDIYSREGIAGDDEMLLRVRAAELGDSFGEDVDTYEAIQNICQTLMQEGFDRISAEYGITEYVEERLAAIFEPGVVLDSPMVHYHCLLMRTGGKDMWTLRRDTGESRVRPYIPLLLWACDNKMSAEVCFNGEEIVREHVGLAEGLPFHFQENWKEISVLEFLNGTMPSKAPKLKAQSSQSIVDVLVERNESLKWWAAKDQDEEGDVFLNRDGKPYTRTTGDVRVAYEGRPDAANSMCLLQFASQYRVIKQNREKQKQEAYEKTVGEIDPNSNVGPGSSDSIAGDYNSVAPTSMRLRDGRIMVKRQGTNAVPRLLYSGAVNKYTNMLLFEPWRELEAIRCAQGDLETGQQRQRRLELFPLSDFKICQDVHEEEEDSNED